MTLVTPFHPAHEKLAELDSRFVKVDQIPWKPTPTPGIDMKVLQKCSDEHGDELLGTAFGYSSWKAVYSTPSVMLGKHMFQGVPRNITAGSYLLLSRAACFFHSLDPILMHFPLQNCALGRNCRVLTAALA